MDDENNYIGKVYNQISDFFGLAEGYIPLSFEGREEMESDHNYELDYEKVREKAKTALGALEESAIWQRQIFSLNIRI